MKLIFISFLILSLCGCGRIKRIPDSANANKLDIYTDDSVIVQTCLDSLSKQFPLNNLIIKVSGVILEKTKYLIGEPNLKWRHSRLEYRDVPVGLEVSIEKMDIGKAHPYILKIDSLSSDGSNAFVRIFCITQRAKTEYGLSKVKGKWVIHDTFCVDYEENAGPTIVK